MRSFNLNADINVLLLVQAVKELEASEQAESLRTRLQHQLKALQKEVWFV